MTATRTSITRFCAQSPFRTPAGRWERAEHLSHSDKRPDQWDDAHVREAWRYLRDLSAADSNTRRAFVQRRRPLLAAAHELFKSDGVTRAEVEARLVAGQSFEEIAAITAVPSAVIQVYETYFFAVLDCLRATDWLLDTVIQFGTSPHSESKVWKWLAIGAPLAVLDLVIADALGRPEPSSVDRHLLAQQARWLCREQDAFCRGECYGAAIVQEGNGLFDDVIQRQRHEDGGDLFMTQLNTIRMVAQLPPYGQPGGPAKHDDPAKQPTHTGRKSAQEKPHGRNADRTRSTPHDQPAAKPTPAAANGNPAA